MVHACHGHTLRLSTLFRRRHAKITTFDDEPVCIQLGFNVHIQSKLIWYTPVMGTHSGYQPCSGGGH